jgi:nucleoid-associated protein YgaU
MASPAATAPAVTGQPGEAAKKPDTYVVKNGDTLRKIAGEKLGDEERVRELIDINPELKRRPNKLYPGQVLELPARKN